MKTCQDPRDYQSTTTLVEEEYPPAAVAISHKHHTAPIALVPLFDVRQKGSSSRKLVVRHILQNLDFPA
jgi:hypothetical protein